MNIIGSAVSKDVEEKLGYIVIAKRKFSYVISMTLFQCIARTCSPVKNKA